ncbi:probable E3 ubiquitin-protein ligase makorin-1 isoform X1 [Diabrotica undecimpunctata]|uniref:probable E3 ubiquitin-protein ligase makorin-1 isoform X1 n=1 Tax=Diabrotica undecimpunctata TaxID=50387 RepID=UPI003B6374F3
MNIGINGNRTICKFNLKGMCRFGTRCWNLHEIPEKSPHKIIEKYEPNEEDGACALPLIKETELSPKNYGPGTSTTETAISLVKKVSESEEKICGICFDIVLKKSRSQQTFGILPNCNHCFCFACIRKWRQSKEFEFEVSKACPECRITSDFVYPSRIWIETKEEKLNFIDGQRHKMKKQDCKYFRQGSGKCPFGNTCLYLHALSNGTVVDVGPPKARRRRGMGSGEREDIDQREVLEQILLWMNDDDDELTNGLFDLDLNDPYIAIQYYDKGDFEYYLAMDQLMNDYGTDDDGDDDDDDISFDY